MFELWYYNNKGDTELLETFENEKLADKVMMVYATEKLGEMPKYWRISTIDKNTKEYDYGSWSEFFRIIKRENNKNDKK